MASGFEIGRGFIRVTADTSRAVAQLAAVTSAAGAAGAALAAVPVAAASLAGIGGVFASSFSGVGDALKAYGKDQDGAAKAARSTAREALQNARQIRNAEKSIADARKDQARVARDSARNIADAEKSIRKAAQDTAEAIADAKDRQADVAESGAERIANAEERVQDTQRDALHAQEALTRAREDAAEQLRDLREATEDFALDEEGAAARVGRAREALRNAMASHHTSTEERAEAEYNLKKALDDQADMTRDHKRATEELTTAEKKGVEGSDKVVQAKERVADAEEAVSDAQQDQVKAARDAAKDNAKAAKVVAEAVEDGVDRQTAAEERLASVREDAAESNADAADRVSDAVENLSDVEAQQAEQALQAAEATNTYADALAKLLPSQRELVKQLIHMGPLVDRLKKAGADAFLPGLVQMLKDSEGLFPILEEHMRDTGNILGDMARDLGDLFQDEGFKKNLDRYFDNSEPVTKAVGDMFVRMTGAIVEFGAETDQTAIGFGHFMNSLTTGMEGFLDKLSEHDDSFRRVWEALGRISEVLLPAVGEALGRLADIAAPIFENIADFFTDHKDELDDWLLAILGFYVALKGAQVAVGVGRMVAGVIAAWNLLPAAARTVLLRVGLFAAGVGLADMILPEADEYWAQQDPLSSLRAYFENQRDDLSDLWDGMLDPAAAFADLQQELDEFPANFAKSPFMQFFGTDLPAWWNGLWGADGEIVRAVSEAPQQIIDGFLTPFNTTGQQVADTITGFFDTYVIQPFRSLFGIASPSKVFFQFGLDLLNGLINGISGMPSAAAQVFLDLFNTTTTWFGSIAQNVFVWSKNTYDNFVAWVSQLPGVAFAWFESTSQTAVSWMENLRDNVGSLAKSLVDGIVHWFSTLPGLAYGWFSTAADFIGLAWARLKEAAAIPVRFVVNTVINDGIISAWNWLSSQAGLGEPIGKVVLPFASGGPVSGPGTATSDSIPALLSNGEHVLTAREVEALGGHKAVERLRMQALNSGQVIDGADHNGPGSSTSGYGGVKPWVAQAGHYLQQKFGITSVGGVGSRPNASDHPKGLALDFMVPVRGKQGDQLSAFLASQANWEHFAIKYQIWRQRIMQSPGSWKNMADRGSTTANHYDHVHVSFLGGAGQGAQDGGGAGFDLWSMLSSPFTGLMNGVRSAIPGIPGTGGFSDILRGLSGKVVDNAVSKAQSVLSGLFGGGDDVAPGSGPVVDQVRAVAAGRGWGSGPQWDALNWLISHESGWRPTAQNPTSTAYGLFQFLNSTWGTVGATKTSNPAQQAAAGLKYIAQRYGSPAGAKGFWQAHHWYDEGGMLPEGTSLVTNNTGKPEPVLTGDQWNKMSGGTTINITVDMSKVKSVDAIIKLVEGLQQERRKGTRIRAGVAV